MRCTVFDRGLLTIGHCQSVYFVLKAAIAFLVQLYGLVQERLCSFTPISILLAK